MGTQVIPGSMRALGIIWLTALWQLFFPGSCSPPPPPHLGLEELHPIPARTVIQPCKSAFFFFLSLPFSEAALSFTETARFWIPVPSTAICKLHPSRKPGQSKVSPCLFPSLRDHNPVLPVFQGLKIITS